MAIGKSAMVLMCFMIAAVAMISIFAIAQTDKPTSTVYTNVTNTINATTQLAQSITTTGTGVMSPLVLIVAIMFFGSVLFIFRKK